MKTNPTLTTFLIEGFIWALVCTSCTRIAPQSTTKITDAPIKMVIGKKEQKYLIDARVDTTVNPTNFLNIQYLGCGGFLIEKDSNQLLIDPFFSNPQIGKVGWSALRHFYSPGKKKKRSKKSLIKPKTDLIDTLLHESVHLSNVTGVLISHAHYDHLFDYPYIENEHLKNKSIKIIGNTSSKKLIGGIINNEIMNVDETRFLTTHQKMGDMISIKKGVDVYPILSDHAPHFESIKLFDGEVCDSLTNYSKYLEGTYAHQWREGKTLAFLIEFIDKADTFRVYLQTSASCPTYGFLPESFGMKIDLAILGIANYDNACNYPDALISKLKPTQILLAHWEDFFLDYDRKKGPKLVRGTDIPAFLDKHLDLIRKNKIHMVEPLTNVMVIKN